MCQKVPIKAQKKEKIGLNIGNVNCIWTIRTLYRHLKVDIFKQYMNF